MEEQILEDKKLCECDCGEWIPVINKKRQKARFKHGHNPQKMGAENPHWKGGKWISHYGYVMVNLGSHNFIPEHRLIVERHLNACLLSWVDVHHINGVKADNRIENLEVMSHGKHMSITAYEGWRSGRLTYEVVNKNMSRSDIVRKSWIKRKQ